ncbi:MAG: hypothetical protein ACSLFA_19000 [Mycobacterium sp.]
MIGSEVAVIADRPDVVGPSLSASGEGGAVTGPSPGATGATGATVPGACSGSVGDSLAVGSSVAAVSVSGEAVDDGEPDVADLGCVLRVEAVIGRLGPLRWVGLDADGDVPVVEDVDVPLEDPAAAADDESSAAEIP